MDNKNVSRMLTAAAQLGLAADSEERAEAAVVARAAQMAEVCKALGLHATSGHAELSAKLAELSTAASTLPKLEAECAALRAERDARVAAERTAHIDALLDASPALKAAKPALEAFAAADFAAFCKAYPRPANTARERALTSSVLPSGGAPSLAAVDAPIRLRSHSEAAGELAQELMDKHPQKFAGDDGYERALVEASRRIKSGLAPVGRS